jgi:hypothetical protein
MKTRTLALMTTTLMAVLPQAFAASTAELAVQGLITPSACTLLLSNGGVIDHGKISFQDLKPNSPTALQPRTLQASATCEGKTLMAIRAIDNRADSSPTNQSDFFGLGMATEDHKLGHYSVEYRDIVADGAPAGSIRSLTGDDWTWESYVDPGFLYAFSSDLHAPIPQALERLDMEFSVRTSINATEGWDVSNEIKIDGAATFEIKYL